MLPSMPILFTRDSQDAFGNKIQPSTSFFNQNLVAKPVIKINNFDPPPLNVIKDSPKVQQNDGKGKTNSKKKDPPKMNDNTLETALVKLFYTKVQSRFSSNPTVPTNKFVQFQNILKSFDPLKETPTDLYRKIESVFGEHNKDIVEEFLLFLKPGQAAEVGRFMDHFMLGQMTKFIDLLQTTFFRKPTVLRKIIRAITTGINSGSSEEMKSRVLPHLRSNPRLTQMFKSLFPDERPPDCLYETGVDVLNESFLVSDKGYDCWEFADGGDSKKKIDAKERLDTMYLHGRVFLQHGRLLRSACVTYPYSKEPYRVHARRLAPNHSHSPPPDLLEQPSPRRNSRNSSKNPPKKPRKQLKSPTKNTKDVNDNTKNKEAIQTTMSPKTSKGKSQSSNRSNKNSKKDIYVKSENVNKRKVDTKNQSCKNEGSKAKQVRFDNSALDIKKIEPKTNSWTRDEDKTMLQVLKGEASSELVFGRIRELLPHRSVTDIKERFCHVMTLLQQMAVGEVT